MLKLKVEINEETKGNVNVKMITPKDTSNNTENEINTARFIVEKMEEIFNGKKEEE